MSERAKEDAPRDAATPQKGGAKGADKSEARRNRGEVHSQVLKTLRHGLMVGAFVPGQVMSLRKLAAQLGTSPMPVRDALSHLVAANVLEAPPNKSVRVPRRNAEWLKEITEVRVLCEGMATKAACAHATPKLIEELSAINCDLLRAIAKRDILGCLQFNQKFHFTLYAAAQSQVLLPLIEDLWLQCGPTMYFSLLAPGMPWDASAHAELLEALHLNDAAMAQRAMTKDIRTTARNVLKLHKGNGSEGPSLHQGELHIELPPAIGPTFIS
ncbi:GntR family transcriptional regulator [Afifella pfennigii]|uniref:GntR family transcriptional regulator n=1 Tax=Afifella pfennigii TaxID=209897 RepID=UPI000AD4881F|nr:GntR family transcriptional regulator [Afifella pfennigii]